jgi:hypothetical protein
MLPMLLKVSELGVGDYFQHRKRWWLRLHEKGGKRHKVRRAIQLRGSFG